MSEGRQMTYLCRGDRKNTYLSFFVFLGIGILGMAAAALRLTAQTTAQAVSFIAFIVAAYIFIRYIATAYRYEMVSEEAGEYLLIVRVQGKREFTQRKLPLSALVAIHQVETAKGAPKNYPKLPIVNYSAHLLADEYSLLQFAGDEPMLFRINADEAFLTALAGYLTDNNETSSAIAEDNPRENDND